MWQRAITRPGGWLHKHPWAVVGFLAGMVAGVVVAKLIAGFPSADAIASIFGAGIGSAMAVLGAVWVASRDERERRRIVLSTLATMSAPTTSGVRELLDYLHADERSNAHVRELLRNCWDLTSTTNTALVNMKAVFERNIGENLAYLLVLGRYSTILSQLQALMNEVGQPENILYDDGWKRRDFTALSDGCDALERDTKFLI